MTNLLFTDPIHFPLDGHGSPSGAARHDLPSHQQLYGERMSASGSAGDALIQRIEGSGLTGRGGAHFPVAIKFRAAREANGRALIVVNGAESEPASAKDAALLQLRPHLVLDGVAAAAETVGANEAVVWLHAGNRAARHSVETAIDERRRAGLPDPAFRIALAPDRYLSGEATAIVNALSGGAVLPVFRPIPAAVSGVDGRPTLLQNAETFARVGALARQTPPEGVPSTMLTVIVGARRIVVDAPATWTLGHAVDRAVGTLAHHDDHQAALVGGYGGSWLSWPAARDVPLSQPAAKARGISIGAGVVAMLPSEHCGVNEATRILRYLADSSARQCGPCLFGLDDLATLMERVTEGSSRRGDLRRLERFSAQIVGRGGCHHPDGAVRMLASALEVFSQDIHAHTKKGRCLCSVDGALVPIPQAV